MEVEVFDLLAKAIPERETTPKDILIKTEARAILAAEPTQAKRYKGDLISRRKAADPA